MTAPIPRSAPREALAAVRAGLVASTEAVATFGVAGPAFVNHELDSTLDAGLAALPVLEAALDEAEREEFATEMHARINEAVSKALGQEFGQSWHDLSEKVAALRSRAERAEAALLDAPGNWFRVGLRVGLKRFAWWSDGVEYVGTCGTTLKEALAESEMVLKDYEVVSDDARAALREGGGA